MIQHAFDFIVKLPPSAASFLGSLAGASAGLVAVVLGALFNAWLNRRRDDRLRRLEREALEQALKVEMRSLQASFQRNAESMKEDEPRGEQAQMLIPNMTSNASIFAAAGDRLLALKPADLDSVLDCYLSMASLFDSLAILSGGRTIQSGNDRSLIVLDNHHAEIFREMADNMAKKFKTAADGIGRR